MPVGLETDVWYADFRSGVKEEIGEDTFKKLVFGILLKGVPKDEPAMTQFYYNVN